MLDPRPESKARANPFEGAANIPLETLSNRPQELSAPATKILIARCEEAEEASRVLRSMGRESEIVPPTPTSEFRQTPLWRPNPVLVEIAETLKPGHAVDLGCGSGRDAVWLAMQGWRVTAIDHLPDALTRAKDLAQRYAPEGSVETQDLNLHRELPKGSYDLVWMAYGLFETAFRECDAKVKALETFAPCHREHYGKPTRVLTLETCRGWQLGKELLAEEGWRGDRCTVRYAVQTR
ncbi:hypothetical protein BH11ARM2_BH11ARM2_17980 [soil metagenome]